MEDNPVTMNDLIARAASVGEPLTARGETVAVAESSAGGLDLLKACLRERSA